MVKAQAGILETDDTAAAEAKLAQAVTDVVAGPDADWVRRHLGTLVGLGEVSLGRRPAQRGVLRLDALLRGARGAAPARARIRGPALGRRRPAGLRRPPRRVGDGSADPGRRHGAAGAARAPAGVGRRQGERDHALALAALERRHCAADRLAARAARCSRPASRPTCSRARAATRSTPSSTRRCSPSAATARTLPLPESVQGIIGARLDALSTEEKRLLQDAAVIGKVFWPGAVARARQRAGSTSGCTRSSASSSSAASAAPRWPARRSTRSSICSCATSRTARSRGRAGSRSTRRPRSGSRPTAGPRTTRRCSRTTTSALSSSRARRGQDVGAIAPRARAALAEAGDRALTLNAFAAGGSLLSRGARPLAGGRARRARRPEAPGRPRRLLGRRGGPARDPRGGSLGAARGGRSRPGRRGRRAGSASSGGSKGGTTTPSRTSSVRTTSSAMPHPRRARSSCLVSSRAIGCSRTTSTRNWRSRRSGWRGRSALSSARHTT